ncbi:hypothetical protein FFLO_07144 [Filobasidium floriforme]|uniref:Uncharacterized protein n=1 Tax=Filobasidium floriforme TaxID=5210 RepID=A0A8K0NJY4_9TREE|nr:uncharacterized protein HD553DRAFT_339674 [Filobasidium floriforme]KAG7527228.1 hypothetical protein FFLO_07144 [Filobasidium floriforme]KAH8088330.1 hypothetical protein HD553DRAFT_339674 [Filobasidium floriforme]
MQYENARIWACFEVGLIPNTSQIVSSCGARAWSAIRASAVLGANKTKKVMGHKANSSALEDIYDHAQEAIDWRGAMLGEKALAVDLHHQPFIRFDTPFGYLLPRPSL